MPISQISDHLYHHESSCHTYLVRNGNEAVVIDIGDGSVLDALASKGIERVTDVLLTHHHRDQAQGLARAVAQGARVWVPHVEQELFHSVDGHWQAREVYNNYNVRQDRFSLLEPVVVSGTLDDYATHSFGGHAFEVVPTPGHTVGSITLLATIDGQRVAFTGDLIAGPGKVWSLAATQWSYVGAEGAAASVLSLLDLRERRPELLLPSHGEFMAQPVAAIDLLVERLSQLLRLRNQYPRLHDFVARPYQEVTPHVLLNRTCFAHSYVVLSKSGKALLIDFGYDFAIAGSGADRSSRRPWLYTLHKLKAEYGVERIDAVIATHFHDDHVAGFNLLRRVEKTQVWAAENFSDLLQNPGRYDLPCLWYDPIPVDRVLRFGEPITWEEYTFTVHPQPGHTLHACAIAFEADGKRILAIGDQQDGSGHLANYVYKNRFRMNDYVDSARLYRELQPELILTGHWGVIEGTPEYLTKLEQSGAELRAIHEALLPLEQVHFDAEGFSAWIRPYQIDMVAGSTATFDVEVRNPLPSDVEVTLRVITPAGWSVANEPTLLLQAHAHHTVPITVTAPPDLSVRRARIAVEPVYGTRTFGQQAEALINVRIGE